MRGAPQSKSQRLSVGSTPADQLDRRPASQVARLPAPIAAKTTRCQRNNVLGRMIVMALRIDGNQRYSWMKNRRSVGELDAAAYLALQHDELMPERSISASSRLFDLNGDQQPQERSIAARPSRSTLSDLITGSIRTRFWVFTVVLWHRTGFRLHWRWRSRRPGRPKTRTEIRELIRRMPRPVQLPCTGNNIIAFPEVGGLHHRYERRAA